MCCQGQPAGETEMLFQLGQAKQQLAVRRAASSKPFAKQLEKGEVERMKTQAQQQAQQQAQLQAQQQAQQQAHQQAQQQRAEPSGSQDVYSTPREAPGVNQSQSGLPKRIKADPDRMSTAVGAAAVPSSPATANRYATGCNLALNSCDCACTCQAETSAPN